MKVQEDFNMTGKPNKKYSPEFKKEAVEKYLCGLYGGYDLLSKELGLRSSRQLKVWVKLYQQDPELLKVDGRHFGKKDGVQKGWPKRIKLEELSKDEQIEYLKMENAVLKKVKALRKNYGEH
jgi:transposase-like protein